MLVIASVILCTLFKFVDYWQLKLRISLQRLQGLENPGRPGLRFTTKSKKYFLFMIEITHC